MDLHPLRFQPLFRRYIWGGRRLGTLLNKPIGPGEDFAESWELVDRADDQSVVRFGTFAGTTIGQMIERFGNDLLGEGCFREITDPARPTALQFRFPLLLKYLDANRVLSVQVHPDDDYATRMTDPDLGKTEAWVVLHAEPDSVIYAGLKSGVGPDELRLAVEQGLAETCLHENRPQPGDCLWIPAGTVHAIGAGLVIAEIQQSSDTTFRLYDWNRLDKNGDPRPLHVEQSYQVIDFRRGPVGPQIPKPISGQDNAAGQQLVDCDKFVLNRWRFDTPISIGGDGRFRLLTVTLGSLNLHGDPSYQPLSLAESALLPACLPPVTCSPNEPTELLEIFQR